MTTDTVGGVWTYALELAAALCAHDVEVVLATMGPAMSARQREQAERLTNVQVRQSTFKLEWMDEPWEDVQRAGEWLLDLEREHAPDVVHLNGYAHGALPWRAPAIVVAHSCVLSWWEAVKGELAPPQWDRYREEVSRGLAGADLVVAPSRAMLACVEKHYGGPRRARVIYNGRDPAHFPSTEADKEDLILAAGRMWDEAKNLEALRRIAPRLPWLVYVAGEERRPDGLDRPMDNLHALGRLDPAELAEWYGRAAIYALPARYEPFGLSVLEAALSRCALVLGDIASLREIWGDAALLVPPDDVDVLEAELRMLIANPIRRIELAERARARARWFTPQRMAQGYFEAYQGLLRQEIVAERDASEMSEVWPAQVFQE